VTARKTYNDFFQNTLLTVTPTPRHTASLWLPVGCPETCAAGYKPTGGEWAGAVAQQETAITASSAQPRQLREPDGKHRIVRSVTIEYWVSGQPYVGCAAWVRTTVGAVMVRLIAITPAKIHRP
jgi:hypothetical protein